MLKTVFRSWLVVGWVTIATVTVVMSVAMDAALSTTAFLFALGMAPAIVTMMLSDGSRSPAVTEILYSVDSQGRP